MTESGVRRSAPGGEETAAGSDSNIELSVVMPCLDEAETLQICIEKAMTTFQKLQVRGEVVIADNGSTDGSREIALRCGARVVDVPIPGYGSALMGGIEAARGEYIIMGDADDSYDFTALGVFLDKLREGYDLVMGNRFHGGIQPGAMPPLHRYLGNPVLTGIGRLLFKSESHDFHCGLRGFHRDTIDRMNLQTTGMEFASEMVVKAALLGMRVTEVPTTLSPDGRSHPPHLRSWRDGWRHLRFLLLYSPRWLFLYPGVLLMFLGVAVGLWILPGARRLGGIEFDIHTLIYAAAAVYLGYQSISFAVFTKIYAVSEGLMPEDPRLSRLFKFVTLEVGVAVGLLLVLLGLAGTVWALTDWGGRSFGPLEPTETLRIVIPSSLALSLGVQIVLTSFFLSVLGMRRKRG